jgi:hypothetical protein
MDTMVVAAAHAQHATGIWECRLSLQLKQHGVELLDELFTRGHDALPVLARGSILDGLARQQVAKILELVLRGLHVLQRLQPARQKGEGLLVLLPVDQLEVLLLVDRVEQALVALERRTRAQLLHLGPVALDDGLPHALEDRPPVELLLRLDVRLILDRHHARDEPLVLQVLDHHTQHVILNALGCRIEKLLATRNGTPRRRAHVACRGSLGVRRQSVLAQHPLPLLVIVVGAAATAATGNFVLCGTIAAHGTVWGGRRHSAALCRLHSAAVPARGRHSFPTT